MTPRLSLLCRSSRQIPAAGAVRKPIVLGAIIFVALACPLRAEEKAEQPLVLEFEHCGHFEFVVHVGEDFHFVTMKDGVRTVVDGSILSLDDGTCRLKFSISRCVKGGSAFVSIGQETATLEVGEPPYGSHGSSHNSCTTTGPWIRRGLDPVPSLKAALARGGESYYAAAAMLRTLGPRGAEAVPVLIDVLRGKLEFPPDAVGWSSQEIAAMTLGEIGSAAHEAIPALLELQGVDERTRVEMAVALWKIDRHPTAIPKLIVLLRHGERDTRRAVLRLFDEEIGAAALQAAPAIKELLDSDDEWLCQDAASALWRVARDHEAIATHIDGLTSGDEDIRDYAAARLGRIGPAAREAVPALVQALFLGGHWSTTDTIIEALALIDPSARQVLPLLTAAVREDSGVASAAGKALGRMGPGVLPHMQEFMASDDPGLRDMGTLAMYYAGADAVPFLEEMLDHPDPNVGEAAAYCLRDLGDQATDAIPSLIQCLADDRPKIPNGVGAALVEMGEQSVGPLERLLDHENERVRQIAKRLLSEIEPPREEDAAPEMTLECLPD